MHHFVDFAKPFRMPDFFLIAGLFGSRVLYRSTRSFVDTKVLFFVYFYAVWVTINFLLYHRRSVFGPQWVELWLEYLTSYVQPPPGQLWFIYLLPFFFIAIRLTRSVPPALVLCAAVILELLSIHTGSKIIDRFCEYFVFFYSGVLFAPWTFKIADWARNNLHSAIILIGVWAVLNAVLIANGAFLITGIHLLMGYAGVGAVLLIATVLSTCRGMQWFGYLGRNSLPIYLGFVIPLGVLKKFLVDNKLITDPGVASLVLTLISIPSALLLYWVLRKTPLKVLFARPQWASIDRQNLVLPKLDGQDRPTGPV